MSYLDNVRTFVRIYELGSMSAAARDQRVSPAVVSARISQLEDRLGVRLFQRATRSLSPTEPGAIFYDGACAILATSRRRRPRSARPRRRRAAFCTWQRRSSSAGA